MIKVTLKIENEDTKITKDILFDNYVELVSTDWNKKIDEIVEILADVPLNETNK